MKKIIFTEVLYVGNLYYKGELMQRMYDIKIKHLKRQWDALDFNTSMWKVLLALKDYLK